MQAIHAAQRFVKRMKDARPTAPQLTKADRLLKDLIAVRWDDASPDETGGRLGCLLLLSAAQAMIPEMPVLRKERPNGEHVR